LYKDLTKFILTSDVAGKQVPHTCPAIS